MENQPYVFISYAHLDGATVLPCVETMKSSGINLWFDEGIEAGSEWPEFIAEKVVGCSKFVLFISNAYLNSQNCKRELNFAISRKKEILSVFLEDVQLSPGVEMQLGTYQAIYRGRFDNDATFRTSLGNERFFDSCRAGGAPKAQPQQNYSQQPAYTQPQQTYTQPQQPNYSQPQQPTYAQPKPYTPTNYNTNATVPVNPVAPVVHSPVAKNKNRALALILCFFLGYFGGHKFYLGKPVLGIIYIVMLATGTLAPVTIILVWVDFFILLFMKNDKFDQKFNQPKAK